jgi:predicted RNA-binding protein YlxR (DUF448 family)
MPNKSSKAKFIPQRMCVICRKRNVKLNLLRFVIIEKEIVFDFQNKIEARGYYVCKDNKCINSIYKWLKKKNKKNNGK